MKLLIKGICLLLLSTSIIAQQQDCPTLSELGIIQFNDDNMNLPIPKTSDQSLCGVLSEGEYCYGGWNLMKEDSAQGWLFLITLPGVGEIDALTTLNQSAIFTTPSEYDPALGCFGAIGNLEWNLYPPNNYVAKKIAKMYLQSGQ